jgi:hypothetical protein
MPLIRADLDEKHKRMASAPFSFMRATFYRWCHVWRKAAGDEARATQVLAVGDLHLENFGTWRDTDGRLIWGINDFDETATLPWTQDLVRLATSAHLAIVDQHIRIPRRTADNPSPPRHRGRLHVPDLRVARCACGTSGTAPDAAAARPGELLDNAHFRQNQGPMMRAARIAEVETPAFATST